MNAKKIIKRAMPPLFADVLKKYSIIKPYPGQPFKEINVNIDHDLQLIFLHNPKTAGTSIKESVGLAKAQFGANHKTAEFFVHPKTWESYFSFVVIRHPIDRFISSFKFHTNVNYRGGVIA
jgi:hypothetical protein